MRHRTPVVVPTPEFGANVAPGALVGYCGAENAFKCLNRATRDRYRLVEASTEPSGSCRPRVVMGIQSGTSSPSGLRRRNAIRNSWGSHLPPGVRIVFVLSRYGRAPTDASFPDVLRVDAQETSDLITSPTPYSNFTRRGRAMPTFKQFAFFVAAVKKWPKADFIGKVDDDTLVHLDVVLPILCRAMNTPSAFVGSIHWTSVVPRDERAGVLLDACAFGWTRVASLRALIGSPSCQRRGATLPIPYAAGAAYFFARPLLRELVAAQHIRKWVRDAGGPSRNSLQWQKHEDSSTGYFLTYLPVNVTYVHMGARLHDFRCRPKQKARSNALYRPADPVLSGLVHSLKCPSLHEYAAAALASDSYNETECRAALRRC